MSNQDALSNKENLGMGSAIQLRFKLSWSCYFALSEGINSFLLDFWSLETVLETVFESATL